MKPIVETDISRAASSFAKDATLIKYRWERKIIQNKEDYLLFSLAGEMKRQLSLKRMWKSKQISFQVKFKNR